MTCWTTRNAGQEGKGAKVDDAKFSYNGKFHGYDKVDDGGWQDKC